MKKSLLPLLLAIAVIFKAGAQSGHAGIVTNTNDTIPGGQQCIGLTASVVGAAQTSSYTVGGITYNPQAAYNQGTSLGIHADDLWSDTVTLPFNFCFFDSAYNKIIVSDNGVISFNLSHANAFSDWMIPGPIPFSNTNTTPDMLNSIMSPWHDMDPSFQGSIQYYVGGAYPNRYVVVSWYNETMFGSDSSVDNAFCNLDYHETQEIVLYETSNIIDVYIQQKDTECSGLNAGADWNGDLAIEGIYDITGTMAYTVPGRNSTKWIATHDAWRFTPSGANTASSITWVANSTIVGTGNSVNVCPTTTTTYHLITAIAGCDGTQTTFLDSVTVTPASGSFAFIAPAISFPDCVHTGSITAVATGGPAPYFYKWGNGVTGAADTALSAGTYSVTAYDFLNDSIVTSYQLQNGVALAATGAVVVQPGCPGPGSINIQGVPGWNNTDTYVWNTSQTSANLTNLNAGTYTVTVTDTAGCTASATYVVQSASTPVTLSFTSRNITCNGGNTGEIDVTASSGGPFVYFWSNGERTSRDTDLIAGTYAVTVSNLSGCSATGAFTVSQTGSSMVATITVTYPTCIHDTDGRITAAVAGGNVPYSFNWSNGEQGQVDSNLSAGVYVLTVTDGGGCHIYLWDTLSSQLSLTPYLIIYGDSNFCASSAATFSVSYTYGGGTSPSYQWQVNGQNVGTDTTIYTGTSFNNNDVVTCILTSSSNCASPQSVTSAGIYIHTNPAPAQSLCRVTADSTGVQNDVIWEKANKPATDSFFIYRCQTPDSNYAQTAAIPRDSLSDYVDATGNPQLGSYRYKINLKDTCGQYSVLSDYIQTVYLQYNGNGNFSWIPYEVENQTNPVTVYQVWCDSTGTGTWFLAASANIDSNTVTLFSNVIYPSGNYQLRALLGTTCTPTRANSIVYSNIITHLLTDVHFIPAGAITLRPNPTHNQFEIVNTNANNNLLSFTMFDEIGNRIQVPYTLTGTSKINADISQLAAGMYYVQVNYTNSHAVMKVVKQ